MRLIPCTSCHRHIQADESVCPFCATELSSTAAARPSISGRLTRAAVFASAVTAATGCGSTQPEAKKGGLDAIAHEDAGPSEFAQPPGAIDAAVVQHDSDRDNDVDEELDRHVDDRDYDNEAMPYGAPPSRRRLV